MTSSDLAVSGLLRFGRLGPLPSNPVPLESAYATLDMSRVRVGDGPVGNDEIHGLIGAHPSRDQDARGHRDTTVAACSAVDQNAAACFEDEHGCGGSSAEEKERDGDGRTVDARQPLEVKGRPCQRPWRREPDHAEHEIYAKPTHVLDVAATRP